MDALGHQRFAIAGHDTGMWIGYALAADHPDRVDRLAVAEAAMPGVSPSPPLFGSTQADDRLWHFAFNRLAAVNEQLVTGREDVYFGFQFAKAARKLPDDVVRYYVEALAAESEALRGSFAAYRALDATIAQNEQRKTRRLRMPVLAIGGAEGIGEGAANTMRLAADDVQSVVIPGSGHYCLEEVPEEVVAALTPQCGPHCIQVFSAKFGTNANPNFVETVFQGVATVGQPTIVAPPAAPTRRGTSSPRIPPRGAWCLTSSPPGWCPPR
jgi:pimeloyl-ACP methyl ester carboxylesterase